ncbi:MAG: class I tRNA ligase family protein [Verrucomicrobiales bacterium]
MRLPNTQPINEKTFEKRSRATEPFQKLVNQGLILGEDGQKMSKSRSKVVNSDDVVPEYGADALRLYEMFMGPLEQVKPWQMKGVEGVSRFLARVWRVAFKETETEIKISPKIQDSHVRTRSFSASSRRRSRKSARTSRNSVSTPRSHR